MTFVIATVQQKGGSGKSTISANIATSLKKLGLSIKIIDIDPQKTLNYWFEVRQKNQFNQILPIELVTCSGWKVANEISASKAKVTIIDSPPHLESETKAAIRAADLVIIPIQVTPNDLWASGKIIEYILHEKKKILVVLNRVTHHSKLIAEVDNFIPNYLQKFSVSNRAIFANSMFNGLTAIEVDPKSLAAQEILLIAKEIFSLIKL